MLGALAAFVSQIAHGFMTLSKVEIGIVSDFSVVVFGSTRFSVELTFQGALVEMPWHCELGYCVK